MRRIRSDVIKSCVSDADWATGDVIVIDKKGDRQPDFWLLNLASGGTYLPAFKILFDVSNGELVNVSYRSST